MPLMSWNDSLYVGVNEIDNDHKQLLLLANSLYDAILSGKGQEVLAELFDDLAEYTRGHFQREERRFLATAYPDVTMHLREHSEMVTWVSNARGRFLKKAKCGPSLELMSYLKDWLFHHIANVDREMAPYLMGNSD